MGAYVFLFVKYIILPLKQGFMKFHSLICQKKSSDFIEILRLEQYAQDQILLSPIYFIIYNITNPEINILIYSCI